MRPPPHGPFSLGARPRFFLGPGQKEMGSNPALSPLQASVRRKPFAARHRASRARHAIQAVRHAAALQKSADDDGDANAGHMLRDQQQRNHERRKKDDAQHSDFGPADFLKLLTAVTTDQA